MQQLLGNVAVFERPSLRNKCEVLCFRAGKLLKEREFGGKMQNIGLEMRKCVAGGQKMGLQTPNSIFRPGKRAHIRRGGGRISTKEAAHSEKAGANAAGRGKKSAALHGGVRREGWFCGDRRRSA